MHRFTIIQWAIKYVLCLKKLTNVIILITVQGCLHNIQNHSPPFKTVHTDFIQMFYISCVGFVLDYLKSEWN
jgi:hypothetical protein